MVNKIGAKIRLLAAAALLLAGPADAAAPAAVTITPLVSATATPSGQPIVMPQGDARVIASLYIIAPGARLPLHKHPFPREAYVLAGNLRVTDTDTHQVFTYKPGDFIVEVIGQWHFAENTGSTPVRLLVIDTVPQAVTGNTVKASN
jgi:quercetin dioxygenase-like cupin family protein